MDSQRMQTASSPYSQSPGLCVFQSTASRWEGDRKGPCCVGLTEFQVHLFVTKMTLFLRVKLFWSEWSKLCQNGIVSSVSSEKHSVTQLLRNIAGGWANETPGEAIVARGHLDPKCCALRVLPRSIRSGRGYALLMRRALQRPSVVTTEGNLLFYGQKRKSQRGSSKEIGLPVKAGDLFPSNMLYQQGTFTFALAWGHWLSSGQAISRRYLLI